MSMALKASVRERVKRQQLEDQNQACRRVSAYSSCALADNVQYVRGRGEVVHAFQAALAEELSVSAGETVRLI